MGSKCLIKLTDLEFVDQSQKNVCFLIFLVSSHECAKFQLHLVSFNSKIWEKNYFSQALDMHSVFSKIFGLRILFSIYSDIILVRYGTGNLVSRIQMSKSNRGLWIEELFLIVQQRDIK